MKTENRICKECNGILNGRSDKVFCSQACRNTNKSKQAQNKKNEGLKFRFSGQTP
jgi:hypothetical protein